LILQPSLTTLKIPVVDAFAEFEMLLQMIIFVHLNILFVRRALE
jgi:hypothetical protein